jgi:Terminase large subunit, T4likevirus-type, N-terminal
MKEINIGIGLSYPQFDFYHSTAKNTAVVAGFGSGKTEGSMFRKLDTMFDYPGSNMGYFAPTIPLIKDIFYPKISEELDRRKVRHRILDQKNIVMIPGYGKIFCKTMDNPDNIVGFEILDAFIDELDILKEAKAVKAYRKIKARCRQKIRCKKKQRKFWRKAGYKGKFKPSQMFVSTTPEGFKATYKLFKKKPIKGEKNSIYLKNSKLIQMSTYSNLSNLPDDYISDLLETYPANLVNAYINGIFVNLVHMPVWCNFDRRYNVSFESVQGNEPLHIGIDFNVGRGCAVIYVMREGLPVAVDEIVNSYDTPATIKIIKERYPNNTITVYPDATGKSRKSVNATVSDLALLTDEGWIIKVRSKNPNIKDRISATNAMFLNGLFERRLLVNVLRCPYFTECLEQQVYDNNGVPEKGEGKLDDIGDAGSYPIAFLYPIKKITTTVSEFLI